MPKEDLKTEILAGGTRVNVSKWHKFGADALLLSHFCSVKRMQKVCDLGTGCGIIPLRLFDRGHKGRCVGIDIVPQAINLLEKSIKENNAQNIIPICMDLKNILPCNIKNIEKENNVSSNNLKTIKELLTTTQYDVVTCNPPYFTGGFISPVQERAGARHEENCNITDVCKAAAYLLKDGGKLCICQRPQRLADIICAMREANIEPKRMQFVTAQPLKEAWLVLIEGQKNRASGLKILPTIITENPDGTRPSPEMRKIYEE